jgi:hypothetical protein
MKPPRSHLRCSASLEPTGFNVKTFTVPDISMIRKIDVVSTIVIGSSRAISTSKIRKITTITKNCSENNLFGSSSHSNVDLFSGL